MPEAGGQSVGGQENRGDNQTLLQRMLSAGPQGVMQAAGLFFTLASFLAFGYAIISLIYRGGASSALSPARPDFNVWQDLVQPNFNLFALVIVGIVSALIALRLFSRATALISQIVRPAEAAYLWPLISGANKAAINEYIRLASLTGFSGTFTKLGFTGLPLVTVALTLILLAMTLLLQKQPDQTLAKGIFDLAKLTLGAFLGSFVQRNIEQEKLVGGRNLGGMGDVAPPTQKVPADRAAPVGPAAAAEGPAAAAEGPAAAAEGPAAAAEGPAAAAENAAANKGG